MNKELIEQLFSGLCCSECKSDFTQDSFRVMRQENDIFVVKVTCTKCGKSFGTAFFGHCSLNRKEKSENLALEIQEGPDPISYDDVIDAHNFIKNLEHDWQKYIPEDLRQ